MVDLKILYEDNNYIVCIKPPGILSQRDKSCNKNMEDIIGGNVYCVHRLDREASGIMVYARNKSAAADLSRQIVQGDFKKEYLIKIHGRPLENEGYFEDLLFKDSSKNKSFVVKKERKGVKTARLFYNVVSSDNYSSVIKVKLYTGRTHQIRVQFASRKMPVFGDRKYGARDDCQLALFLSRISFIDKLSGIRKEFSGECDF